MQLDVSNFKGWRVLAALHSVAVTIRHIPEPSEPITPGELEAIIQLLLLCDEWPGLVAFATISFTSTLRQGSITPHAVSQFDETRHMCRSDIHFNKQGASISHKWAKCEQRSHAPESISLPEIQDSVLCPVHALKRLFSRAPTSSPYQPLITFRDGRVMPVSYIRKYWKWAIKEARILDKKVTLHSLRKGSADYLQSILKDTSKVATHGRWESNVVGRYVRREVARQTNEAFGRLSHTKRQYRF